MANVAEWVARIRAAVYGEEVRESIARSIEEMNQDNIDTQAHYDSTIVQAEAATAAANDAAADAEDIRDVVQAHLDHGDFIGAQGPQGVAATITIGTVQTGQPGSAAQVRNTGTASDAVLAFVIPQGATGDVDNLDSVAISFGIDSTYQNIASGMTITQLFSRIQLLLDMIMITDNEMTALERKLGI